MNTELHFQTGVKNNWETPDDLFEARHFVQRFTLDAAADETNHKLPRWFGPGGLHEDCFAASWAGERFWLNPVYGEPEQACVRNCKKKRCPLRGWHAETYLYGQIDFVGKAKQQVMDHPGTMGELLLPARTDTQVFHHFIYDRQRNDWHPWVRRVQFLEGRLTFKGAPNPAPFPSMIVEFSR